MRLPQKLGTVYRGGQGQWSWALHRITGVAIFLFLLAHIIDTALVGFGPEVYNRVIAVYHNPIVRLMEIALALLVLFHALNGLRIIVIDFPARDDVNWLKHSLAWKTNGTVKLSSKPVTITRYQPQERKY